MASKTTWDSGVPWRDENHRTFGLENKGEQIIGLYRHCTTLLHVSIWDPRCSLVSSSDSGPGSISHWLCPLCGSAAPLALSGNADGCIVHTLQDCTHHCPAVLSQGEAVPYCPGQWAVLSLQCAQFPPSSTPRNILSELPLSFPPFPLFSLHWLPWQVHTRRSFWCAGMCISCSWQEQGSTVKEEKSAISLQTILISIPNPSVAFCCWVFTEK